MLSLLFICSRKLVSDHGSLRSALHLIPSELYPVLFRAAFLEQKTLVLQDLVQRWPFPVLSLQKLLQGDGRHHPPLHHKASKLCVQTVILGVMAYLREALAGQKDGQPLRKQSLRLLDMTGTHDGGLEQRPDTMSLWSRTVTLAKSCIDISRTQCREVAQVSKRRKGSNDAALSSAAGAVCVAVRADLFVNSTSYGVLREALLVSARGPLCLQCRDIWAEELSLRSTAGLLELLNPTGLRQIDLRYNNLGLSGLNALLPHMMRFTHLQSLKLPYSNIDVRRLSPAAEEDMQNFASQICQLPALKELNLGSSRLSGRIQQLLGGLRTPLESVELAFCCLLPADLHYLSRSFHVSSLRKLDLSGNNLSGVLLQPFLQLLDQACSSLQCLDVMDCKLRDSTLSALTPALCRCRCLRYLGLLDNPLSAQSIRTLLQSSLHLAELQLVIYPLPLECHPGSADESGPAVIGFVDCDKEAQFKAEVQEVLVRAQRTDVVWTADMVTHRPPEYLSL